MKISPIEIKQQTFSTKMLGYSKEEVDAFLSVVSDEFAAQKSEIRQFAQAVKRLEEELEESRKNSTELKTLTFSINSLKSDLLKNAEKEASLKIEEAKVKATRMIQAAERRVRELEAHLKVLEERKRAVKENVSSFLQNQLTSLMTLNTAFEKERTVSPLSGFEGENDTREKGMPEPIEVEETTPEREQSEKSPFRGSIMEDELVVPAEDLLESDFADGIEVEPRSGRR